MKRDFWDMSFNPVWGCLYKCPFCYARKFAKRYAEQIAKKEMMYLLQFGQLDVDECIAEMVEKLKTFQPIWLESNYVRRFPQKPSIIFVNSMSDPAYWEKEWYEKTVKRIAENMQHTFVVLTKQPGVYEKYTFPHNTILGVTITNNTELSRFVTMLMLPACSNKFLVCIEPIQEKIDMSFFSDKHCGDDIDWIHVGQESGNRKDKVRATREMIEPFFDLDIPVFMKNNLTGIVPGRELRKEFP